MAGRAPREQASETLVRLIENLGSSPACILGRRWDFLTWNDAYAVVFSDPSELPPERRNMIWATFMEPPRRTLFTDWTEGAQQVVARFRADSARHVGDPEFDELIDELKRGSSDFNRWWRRHEVVRSGIGRKLLLHPVAGEMAFEHAVFKLEESPEQRLVLYTPLSDDETAEKVQRLLARRQ